MAGDLVYFWMPIPDLEKGKAFFGALLGWEFEAGNVPEGAQITNVSPPGGLHGGQSARSLPLCFEVDDLDAVIDRIRELGGETDGVPNPTGEGAFLYCKDDQGTEFCVSARSSG